MTSKERVMAAFNRQPTDRPPTSLRCTPEVWAALQKHFGVDTNEDVLDELDIDMRMVYLPYIGPKERSTPPMGGNGVDFWGNEWIEAKNEYNTYYDIHKPGLANAGSIEEVMDYEWPSLDWWDYSAIPKAIEAHSKKGERAIMFFAGGSFETPWYIRGFEQFLMDLYIAPEITDAICQKVTEYYKARAMRVLEAADGKIDIIGSGGDIGGEEGMILKPELWRERIKPYSKQLIRTFKDMGLGTFYHSCGSLVPAINDLIEIGLDVLEPIQVTAKGMQPEPLFEEFGDRISFHGAIDEVHLLPHATPDEVYKETQRIISILGKNHGFIVSPSHQVQGDTSVENVLAIYKAAQDYKY